MDKELKYHKQVYTYNAMRLPSSVIFMGVNGKPILVAGGYATIKYRYNSQNQCVERGYYGTGGARVNNASGFSREVYTFRDGTEYKCDLYAASGKNLLRLSERMGNGMLKVWDKIGSRMVWLGKHSGDREQHNVL